MYKLVRERARLGGEGERVRGCCNAVDGVMHGYGGPSHSRQAYALVLSALSELECSARVLYMRLTSLNHHKSGDRPDLSTRCAAPRCHSVCPLLRGPGGIALVSWRRRPRWFRHDKSCGAGPNDA